MKISSQKPESLHELALNVCFFVSIKNPRYIYVVFTTGQSFNIEPYIVCVKIKKKILRNYKFDWDQFVHVG